MDHHPLPGHQKLQLLLTSVQGQLPVHQRDRCPLPHLHHHQLQPPDPSGDAGLQHQLLQEDQVSHILSRNCPVQRFHHQNLSMDITPPPITCLRGRRSSTTPVPVVATATFLPGPWLSSQMTSISTGESSTSGTWRDREGVR